MGDRVGFGERRRDPGPPREELAEGLVAACERLLLQVADQEFFGSTDHAPRIGRHQACAHPKEGRLADAVGSEQSDA